MTKDSLNIHLYPSNLLFETRIDKIVSAIDASNIFTAIWVIGVNEGSLPKREKRVNRIEYIRISDNSSGKSFIDKLKRFIKYYISVIYLLKDRRLTCVNAHSLSVLPLAVFLKFFKKCKVIYDTHELETETPSLAGLRRLFARIAEKLLIGHADHVFCVSDPIADWYRNQYNFPRPTVILNSPCVNLPKRSEYLRETLQLSKDCIIYVFFGILGPNRGIEELIDLFSNFNDTKFVLILIGYGELENKIKKSSQFERTIFLMPAMPQEHLIDVACSADVGFCLVKPISMSYDYCMPNKIFEYISAGLPVIVGPCTSLIRFVTDNDIGAVATNVTPECIMDTMHSLDKLKIESMRERAYSTYVNNSWQRQSEKLINVYHFLMNELH